MKKLSLLLLMAAMFLIVACSTSPDTDTDVYERTDAYEQPNSYADTDILNQDEDDTVVDPTNPPADERPIHVRQHTTVSVATWHALAIGDDGSLWAWGGHPVRDEQSGEWLPTDKLSPVQIMDDVIHVAAGHDHSLAITADGALWAWGANYFGQLGDGTTEDRTSPVQIMNNVVYAAIAPIDIASHSHRGNSARSYAITADGTLWAWGANGYFDLPGVLGDGTTESRLSPVRIMDNIVAVTLTLNGGFATAEDGAIWVWGGEQLSPVPIADSVDISHRIVPDFLYEIDEHGTLWTRGMNRFPDHWQWAPLVGDGTTDPRPSYVQIMDNVASFKTVADTAFAITEDGALWAWGYNNIGQLGDGTTESRLAPVKIMDNVVSVFSSYWMDHGWVSFVNTFALTENGELWAWGGHSFGAGLIGDGTAEHRLSPVRILDDVRV